MKKFYLRNLPVFLGLLGMLVFSGKSNAQNTRVQFIHNAGAVALDTVDIYLDGTLVLNDVRYRHASGMMLQAHGTYTMDINAATSTGNADQLLASFSLTLDSNSSNVVMIAGVDDTTMAAYAANPLGRDITVSLIKRKGLNIGIGTLLRSVTVLNGVTDAAGFDMSLRPAAAPFILNDVAYGDTTGNLNIAPGDYILDVKQADGTPYKNYDLALGSLNSRSAVVFTSGFMNPAANQNGEDFGVFIADTSGKVIELKESMRMQFVNNSADVHADSVNIWMYNTTTGDSLIIKNLAFRKATSYQVMPAGMYDVVVTRKGSVDTAATDSNVLFRANSQLLLSGGGYLGIISGVANPAEYAVNPSALSTAFALNIFDYSDTSTAGVDMYFSNGVIDAPAITINKLTAPAGNLFSSVNFRSLAGPVKMAASGSSYLITEFLNGSINASYMLNLSGQTGKPALLIASGVYSAAGNPAAAKAYQYLLVLSNGTVMPLSAAGTPYLQIVHASADTSIKKISLFMNGVKITDTLGFRHATPFMPLNAFKTYRIHLGPHDAADTTTAFYGMTLVPDSSKYYYAVATGLVNVAGYAANPEGLNRSFSVVVNANAKITAGLNSKNFDLQYFNSITDAPSTTIKGVEQTQFLSKKNPYKTFNSNYRPHTALDDIEFDVRDEVANRSLFVGYGNFAGYKGLAGLVFASGFLVDSTNKFGAAPMLMLALPNGKVDSIGPKFGVGLMEKVILQGSVVCFPNPATDRINITFESRSASSVKIEVIDIAGRTVVVNDHKSVAGRNDVALNISALHSGIYFVKMTTGDESIVKKVSVLK